MTDYQEKALAYLEPMVLYKHLVHGVPYKDAYVDGFAFLQKKVFRLPDDPGKWDESHCDRISVLLWEYYLKADSIRAFFLWASQNILKNPWAISEMEPVSFSDYAQSIIHLLKRGGYDVIIVTLESPKQLKWRTCCEFANGIPTVLDLEFLYEAGIICLLAAKGKVDSPLWWLIESPPFKEGALQIIKRI